ncbi:hypothetical protein, partial [Rhizobium sullae]|uniref:hypothetical protein n=1 Tax=Rhizobium sullae TaxID=50338 RepID=UPI001AED0445
RQAHNLKAAGSNPAPATKIDHQFNGLRGNSEPFLREKAHPFPEEAVVRERRQDEISLSPPRD